MMSRKPNYCILEQETSIKENLDENKMEIRSGLNLNKIKSSQLESLLSWKAVRIDWKEYIFQDAKDRAYFAQHLFNNRLTAFGFWNTNPFYIEESSASYEILFPYPNKTFLDLLKSNLNASLIKNNHQILEAYSYYFCSILGIKAENFSPEFMHLIFLSAESTDPNEKNKLDELFRLVNEVTSWKEVSLEANIFIDLLKEEYQLIANEKNDENKLKKIRDKSKPFVIWAWWAWAVGWLLFAWPIWWFTLGTLAVWWWTALLIQRNREKKEKRNTPPLPEIEIPKPTINHYTSKLVEIPQIPESPIDKIRKRIREIANSESDRTTNEADAALREAALLTIVETPANKEKLPEIASAVKVLLTSNNKPRLENFFKNCMSNTFYWESVGKDQWKEYWGLDFSDIEKKPNINEAVSYTLFEKLLASSTLITEQHKEKYKRNIQSWKTLSNYAYTNEEIKHMQFTLAMYVWSSTKAFTSYSTPFPDIDWEMRIVDLWDDDQKTTDLLMRLETNRFIYALELNADLNKHIFDHLSMISDAKDRKEVVIQFYKYYSQIRDFHLLYGWEEPTWLLQNYIIALVNHRIDPDSHYLFTIEEVDASGTKKQTQIEMTSSDYLQSCETQTLENLSKVKYHEYMIKIKALQKKLLSFKDRWAEWSIKGKLSQAQQRQVDSYLQLLKDEETGEKSLKALTEVTWGYNDRWNTFLSLNLTVSDEQVTTAYNNSEEKMKALWYSTSNYMHYSFEVKETMMEMYLLQLEMRELSNISYERMEANLKDKRIKHNLKKPEEKDKEVLMQSIVLLGKDSSWKWFYKRSKAMSDYIDDFTKNQNTKTNHPIKLMLNNDVLTAVENRWAYNDYTREVVDNMNYDNGGISDISDIDYNYWSDGHLIEKALWWNYITFRNKILRIVKIWWKNYLADITDLKNHLPTWESSIKRWKYFLDWKWNTVERKKWDMIWFDADAATYTITAENAKDFGYPDTITRSKISSLWVISEPQPLILKLSLPSNKPKLKSSESSFKIFRKVAYKSKNSDEIRDYYFSQPIREKNANLASAWNFDEEGAKKYIDLMEQNAVTGLFNGSSSTWESMDVNKIWGWALEFTPQLKQYVETKNYEASTIAKRNPTLERCKEQANKLKATFGPCLSLLQWAKEWKIPQDLFDRFNTEWGIKQLAWDLEWLRKQFASNGEIDQIIKQFDDYKENFGAYIDDTEAEIIWLIEQLRNIQNQMWENWRIASAINSLNKLTPNTFEYRLKTDGIILLAVILATIAAMTLSGGLWWMFGVLFTGFNGWIAWAAMNELASYNLREFYKSSDPKQLNIKRENITTPAQQWDRSGAVKWWCNQILITTGMSAGIHYLWWRMIIAMRSNSNISWNAISAIEWLVAEWSSSTQSFLKVMFTKWSQKLLQVIQATKNRTPDFVKSAFSWWRELTSELREEAFVEELVGKILWDNGPYLLQFLWYAKKWMNGNKVDIIASLWLSFDNTENGVSRMKYSESPELLLDCYREHSDEYDIMPDPETIAKMKTGEAPLQVIRITHKWKKTSDGKDIVFEFEYTNKSLDERTFASWGGLDDDQVIYDERTHEYIVSIRRLNGEPSNLDAKIKEVLDRMKSQYIAKGIDNNEYELIGTDTTLRVKFVEEIIEYSNPIEESIFGVAALKQIRDEAIEKWVLKPGQNTIEWMNEYMSAHERWDNFATELPKTITIIRNLSESKRILLANALLWRPVSWRWECGPEIELAHNKTSLYDKVNILENHGYTKAERRMLFRWHVCNGFEWKAEECKTRLQETIKWMEIESWFDDIANRAWVNDRTDENAWSSSRDLIEFILISDVTYKNKADKLKEIVMSTPPLISYEMIQKLMVWYQIDTAFDKIYTYLIDARARSEDSETTNQKLFTMMYWEWSTFTLQELQQLEYLAQWKDSQVHIIKWTPNRVIKYYNSVLWRKDLDAYYALMKDFNTHLQRTNPPLATKVKFYNGKHPIIAERQDGRKPEQVVELDYIDGSDYPWSADGTKIAKETLMEFNKELSKYLGISEREYIRFWWPNLKYQSNGTIIITDIDNIHEVLFDSKKLQKEPDLNVNPKLEKETTGSWDEFFDKFETRKEWSPKHEIAEYIRSLDIPWLHVPESYDFATMKSKIESWWNVIIRSDTPYEYAWASGLLESYPFKDGQFKFKDFGNEIKELQTENELHNFLISQYFNSMQQRWMNSIYAYCKASGLSIEEFISTWNYSYQEFIPWENKSIVEDSNIPWRYHLSINKNWEVDNSLIIDKSNTDPTQWTFTPDLEPDKQKDVIEIVNLYSKIKAAPKFDSMNCPVMEFQTDPDGKHYFLQYHKWRNKEAPASFTLDPSVYPETDGWQKASFVRWITPPEGRTINLAVASPAWYTNRGILTQIEWTYNSFQAEVYNSVVAQNKWYITVLHRNSSWKPDSHSEITKLHTGELSVVIDKSLEYNTKADMYSDNYVNWAVLGTISVTIVSDGRNAYVKVNNPDQYGKVEFSKSGWDQFIHKFETKREWNPKAEIADHVEALALSWVKVPERYTFAVMKEKIMKWEKIIIRSDTPYEYAWASGLLESFLSDSNIVKKLNREMINSPKDLTDQLIAHQSREIEDYCRFANIDLQTFKNKTSYTYWQFVEWTNRTVVADDSVPWRYHIFSNGSRYNYSTVDIDASWNLTIHNQSTNPLDKNLEQWVAKLINCYNSVRNAPGFDPKQCPAIEIQTAANGDNYFLQYHITRESKEKPNFYVDEESYPRNEWWMKAAFVRWSTPKEWVDVDIAISLWDDSAVMWLQWNYTGLVWWIGKEIATRNSWFINVQYINDRSNIQTVMDDTVDNHNAKSNIFNPELSLYITEKLIPQFTLETLMNQSSNTWKTVTISVRVISDGTNAVIKVNNPELLPTIQKAPQLSEKTSVMINWVTITKDSFVAWATPDQATIDAIMSIPDTNWWDRMLIAKWLLEANGFDFNANTQAENAEIMDAIWTAHLLKSVVGKYRLLIPMGKWGTNKLTRDQSQLLLAWWVCGEKVSVTMDNKEQVFENTWSIIWTRWLLPCAGILIYNPATDRTHILHDSEWHWVESFLENIPASDRSRCQVYVTWRNPEQGTNPDWYPESVIALRGKAIESITSKWFNKDNMKLHWSEWPDSEWWSIHLNQRTGEVTIIPNGQNWDTISYQAFEWEAPWASRIENPDNITSVEYTTYSPEVIFAMIDDLDSWITTEKKSKAKAFFSRSRWWSAAQLVKKPGTSEGADLEAWVLLWWSGNTELQVDNISPLPNSEQRVFVREILSWYMRADAYSEASDPVDMSKREIASKILSIRYSIIDTSSPHQKTQLLAGLCKKLQYITTTLDGDKVELSMIVKKWKQISPIFEDGFKKLNDKKLTSDEKIQIIHDITQNIKTITWSIDDVYLLQQIARNMWFYGPTMVIGFTRKQCAWLFVGYKNWGIDYSSQSIHNYLSGWEADGDSDISSSGTPTNEIEVANTHLPEIAQEVGMDHAMDPKTCQDLALDHRKDGRKKLTENPKYQVITENISEIMEPRDRALMAIYLLQWYPWIDTVTPETDVDINIIVDWDIRPCDSIEYAIDAIHLATENEKWASDKKSVNEYKAKKLIELFSQINPALTKEQKIEMSTVLLMWNVCGKKFDRDALVYNEKVQLMYRMHEAFWLTDDPKYKRKLRKRTFENMRHTTGNLDQFRKEREQEIEEKIDLTKVLNEKELQAFNWMNELLITNIQYIKNWQLSTALRNNAEYLSTLLYDKENRRQRRWSAQVDDPEHNSESRRRVTDKFISYFRSIKSVNRNGGNYFSPTSTTNNRDVSKKQLEDLDYVVISDDASYSWEQVVRSVDALVRRWVGSTDPKTGYGSLSEVDAQAYMDNNEMPTIVINLWFISQTTLDILNKKSYKILRSWSSPKLIVLPDETQVNRIIPSVGKILASWWYTVKQYNDILIKIYWNTLTTPWNKTEGQYPRLEPDQTVTYCERKIPNHKSLINPIRNNLDIREPEYRTENDQK